MYWIIPIHKLSFVEPYAPCPNFPSNLSLVGRWKQEWEFGRLFEGISTEIDNFQNVHQTIFWWTHWKAVWLVFHLQLMLSWCDEMQSWKCNAGSVAINPVLRPSIDALNSGLKSRWMLSWAVSNASRYIYRVAPLETASPMRCIYTVFLVNTKGLLGRSSMSFTSQKSE